MLKNKLLKGFPFTISPRGALAQPNGFFTSCRWSVFTNGGRYALTGHLMNRHRSLGGGYVA